MPSSRKSKKQVAKSKSQPGCGCQAGGANNLSKKNNPNLTVPLTGLNNNKPIPTNTKPTNTKPSETNKPTSTNTKPSETNKPISTKDRKSTRLNSSQQ